MDPTTHAKPDVNIKPILTLEDAKHIVTELYGLSCNSITELNSYDDKNYKISVSAIFDNEHIKSVCKNGYVLKITNSLDSKNVNFIEAQNSLAIFLGKNGISCPKLVESSKGKYTGLKTLVSGVHVVRLLEFIPGYILHEISADTNLMYDVGRYTAKMDLILKDFHHPGYKNHNTLWMMDSVPLLRELTCVLKDKTKKIMVENIVTEFEERILKIRDKLTPGMIHGDVNEQNVIVHKNNGKWTIHSILDFGDTQFSCYLYELAITMTYMIIHTKDLKAGGHVMAGYTSLLPISENELNLLKISIAARMCQSLVIGAYTNVQYPDNSYLLITAASGWQVLMELWNKPEEEVLQSWKDVITSYQA